MLDVEVIRQPHNYDTDPMIRVLELSEDRPYAWLVLDSLTVVREDLGGAVEYVKALRKVVRSERPKYVSPYEAVLHI